MARKLIAIEDDTMAALKLLGAERMITIQELADEAFHDLIKKHGGGLTVRDALKKSLDKSRRAAPPVSGPAKKAAQKMAGGRRRVARGD
jgi:hypothetical protein